MTSSSSFPRFWADLTSPDFTRLDAAATIAVLPVAAIEQHGPHLPLSVDTDLVNGVIAHCLPHLQNVPVLFLPTQTTGRSIEHIAFAGTLTLGAATLIQGWVDIGECVARTGIKKLVLLNSHGGNVSTLDIVGRELRARFGLTVFTVNTFSLPMPAEVKQLFGPDEERFGVHGGDAETSMMLALHPHKVDMAQAQNFHSSSQDRARQHVILGNGSSAKLAWAAQDLNPQGAAGNAAAATAEKGRVVLQASGLALAQLLNEVGQLATLP
ncbi:MAG: creatininase family protein [Pseudomonadota bacterium]|uniref:creatininase family protein n=1 Tax=Polaromonas sp. TaxID=1869339 RepID=UPI0017AC5F7C|nr:creatininase family protein [Polaromonas sp.]MBA3593048.1 creatininase family protein [Polaromonas sp.]MDQ3270614.1 creatininase family protein [Pseudomonadota bacterium]